MKNSTRAVINSIVLYGRLVVTTVLKLLATRLLVKYLGLEDFGLYNLLAGVVVMLAFFKATLASTSQRFLSVSLGKNNPEDTKEVFYLLSILHAAMAIAIILIIDVVGIVLIENFLNIPIGKEYAATVVVHTLAVSTGVTIICVPHDALLISKENIPMLSLFLVVESLMNILSAYMLIFIDAENRLTSYALLTLGYMFLALVLRVLYNRRYVETHVKWHKIIDFSLFKNIFKYTGWSTISSVFYLARNQGYAILFNLTGGVIVNSAYGIANQVNALVSYATEALMQPLRPQIMKAESNGDRNKSVEIVIFSAKVLQLLLTLIIAPLIVYIDIILNIWIHDVPEYAVAFCRILLVAAYFISFSNGIKSLLEAYGDVKALFSVVGYFHIATLIASTILIVFNISITLAYSIIILEEILCTMFRIMLAKKKISIDALNFIKSLVIPCILVFLFSIILLFIIFTLTDNILCNIMNYLFTVYISILAYNKYIFNIRESSKIKEMFHNFQKHIKKLLNETSKHHK